MRSVAELIELCSEENLLKIEAIFRQPSDEEQFAAAMLLLGINTQHFNNISHQLHRAKILHYQWQYMHFFELSATRYKSQPDFLRLIPRIKQLIEQAYTILTTQAAKLPDSGQSQYSLGISECDSEVNFADITSLTSSQRFSITGKKTAGVEPGFESMDKRDLLKTLDGYFNTSVAAIERFVNRMKVQLEDIYKTVRSDLPKYIVKGDYTLVAKKKNTQPIDPTQFTNSTIELTLADVKRTKTIQKITRFNPIIGRIAARVYAFFKRTTAFKANREAIRECLASDITSILQPTHKQRIVRSRHPNGDLKIMLIAEFEKNSRTLGPLHGDAKHRTRGYAARPLLSQRKYHGKTLQWVADDRIAPSAECLAYWIMADDRDTIGSDGGNYLARETQMDPQTGRAALELIGIDFGHFLENSKNPNIDKLRIDLSLPRSAYKTYKNYSWAMDSNCSQRMQGLLLLAKLAGKEIPKELIEQYQDPNFSQKIDALSPQEDNKVFTDYIEKFQQLADSASVHDKHHYNAIIKDIQNMQQRWEKDKDKFLGRFQHIMRLPPKLLDLTENLRRLSALLANKASLFSPDGQVLLNHIRVDENYPFWHMARNKKTSQYTLTLRVKKKHRQALLASMQSMAKNTEGITLSVKSGKIRVVIDSASIDTLHGLFSEQNILNQVAPEQAQLQASVQSELALIDIATPSLYEKFGIGLTLKKTPNTQQSFRLSWRSIPASPHYHSAYKAIFETLFGTEDAFEFSIDNTTRVTDLLRNCLRDLNTQKQELEEPENIYKTVVHELNEFNGPKRLYDAVIQELKSRHHQDRKLPTPKKSTDIILDKEQAKTYDGLFIEMKSRQRSEVTDFIAKLYLSRIPLANVVNYLTGQKTPRSTWSQLQIYFFPPAQENQDSKQIVTDLKRLLAAYQSGGKVNVNKQLNEQFPWELRRHIPELNRWIDEQLAQDKLCSLGQSTPSMSITSSVAEIISCFPNSYVP